MSKSAGKLLVCLILAAIAGPIPAGAQVLYGTLVGNVIDPSQSAVPAAKVTVTNPATGQTRESVTDDRGFFAFRDLQEGTYTLNVAAQGFVTYSRTGIPITINTVSRADVQLQVGAITETVTVAAHATTLQTDRADVHYELGGKQVSQLPLSGYRNYQSLINLVPGAMPARFQNAITDTPARALTTNINGTSRNTMNTRRRGDQRLYVASAPHAVRASGGVHRDGQHLDEQF